MTGPAIGERVRLARGGQGLWQITHRPGPVAVAAVSCADGRADRLALADIVRSEHRAGAFPELADLEPVAVVGCGAAKLARPAPARDLYTSSTFRLALAAAHELAAPGRVLILSGRYGLVRPGDVLDPYEQRIDAPGAIDPAELSAQARALDLTGARRVHVLAGRAYHRAAAHVWPWAVHELADAPGIGYQRRRLAELARPPRLFDPDALPTVVG